ncbi:MAG: hypothetical protein ABWY25_05165 [Paenisporosarcina sp.]
MATITGFTAERMLVIENETVVDGEVVGDDLVLTTREGTPINAGNVRGPQGPQGIPGIGVDEVWVGSDTPPTTQEFWYDTDDAGPAYGGVPIGGETSQILTKVNDDNYNTTWVHQNNRVFSTKAALDAAQWAGLADGHQAYVVADKRNYVRMGGIWCRNPDFGIHTGTADTNGRIYGIPHLVGKIPAIVVAHGWGTSYNNPIVEQILVASIGVRCFTMQGTSPGAVQLNVAWVAWP